MCTAPSTPRSQQKPRALHLISSHLISCLSYCALQVCLHTCEGYGGKWINCSVYGCASSATSCAQITYRKVRLMHMSSQPATLPGGVLWKDLRTYVACEHFRTLVVLFGMHHDHLISFTELPLPPIAASRPNSPSSPSQSA